MTMLLTEQVSAGEIGGVGDPLRLLDFSLPIPDDSAERVRALSYLHETIDRYISEFCDPSTTEDRHLRADLAAEAAAARKAGYQGVSWPHAAQVFLCFSICLFI